MLRLACEVVAPRKQLMPSLKHWFSRALKTVASGKMQTYVRGFLRPAWHFWNVKHQRRVIFHTYKIIHHPIFIIILLQRHPCWPCSFSIHSWLVSVTMNNQQKLFTLPELDTTINISERYIQLLIYLIYIYIYITKYTYIYIKLHLIMTLGCRQNLYFRSTPVHNDSLKARNLQEAIYLPSRLVL